MLKLCGFSVSNYYNKVKLVLLEKGIEFEEQLVRPSQSEELRKESPMGKVPFLRTNRGVLTESQVILEYIEEVFPEPPLYPKDAFERARNRELIAHLELDVELVARRLYAQAFFGGSVSDATRDEVEPLLARGLAGLARLAKFTPYLAGETFTYADCAAWVHLPVVGQATKAIYGRDMVDEYLPGAKDYVKRIGARPSAQRVTADRKAAVEAFLKSKAQ